MAMTGSPAGPAFEQPFIRCCGLRMLPAIAEQPRAAIGNRFAICLEIERSASAVEGFFAKLTRRRLKRGVFKGVVDLQAAINRFLRETNDNSKPFIWIADPDAIIQKVRRGKQMLESIH